MAEPAFCAILLVVLVCGYFIWLAIHVQLSVADLCPDACFCLLLAPLPQATIADLQADYQDIVPRLISKLAVTNTVNLKLNLKEDLAEAQGKLQLQDTTIAALTASNAELSARLASSLTSESTLKAELSCVAADRDDLAAQLAAG